MVILSKILVPGAVLVAHPAANRKALIQHISAIAEHEYGLESNHVIERLTERERLGSTGFGGGVAIPHGKIDGLGHVVGIFIRLAVAIDFQAIDDLPVDLVFCLLSPPDAGADHLKALAQVSRWLRDSAFIAKLRGAGSNDAVFAIFAGIEAHSVA
jgi:nitrogen PTS system EIIA component